MAVLSSRGAFNQKKLCYPTREGNLMVTDRIYLKKSYVTTSPPPESFPGEGSGLTSRDDLAEVNSYGLSLLETPGLSQ